VFQVCNMEDPNTPGLFSCNLYLSHGFSSILCTLTKVNSHRIDDQQLKTNDKTKNNNQDHGGLDFLHWQVIT